MRVAFWTIFLCMAGINLQAQNLAGVWKGVRTQNAGGCFPEYSLEIHVTYANATSVMGNAYSYYDKERFTKINFTGRYNPNTKRLVIIENLVLQYNIPVNCIPCIKTYDLNWTNKNGEEALEGIWKGHEMGNISACPPGKIHLSREYHPVFPVEVYQNDSLVKLQQGIRLQNREKELVKTIELDSSSIQIDLYDNAEIDDDTVSVFLNNTLLLYKQRLTDRPLTVHITAMPDTDYELMLYADNLGKIPPNTSLMVITAGKKRYEVRLSASEQKSAVIHFKYIKPEP